LPLGSTALESKMSYLIRSFVVVTSVIAVSAGAQPANDSQCRAAATQATGYTPGAPPPPVVNGGRVAGAARGAAAGAVVGEAQNNNRYDRAPEAMQDQHRQNQARSGAAAGVAVAGSRNRQDRRSARRTSASQESAWQSQYNACMQASG
jgi:hypothetical protein